jgi:hypothetical protein
MSYLVCPCLIIYIIEKIKNKLYFGHEMQFKFGDFVTSNSKYVAF